METAASIKAIENQIEEALWSLELHEKNEEAREVYVEAESRLHALGLTSEDPSYAEGQRVLAYCLMRQGNILRQLGKPESALALGERELTAARASGDEITVARSLMSNGTNRIIGGRTEAGLEQIEEARGLFERGDGYDYRQGLGWYWILQCDLANAGILTREPAEVIEMASAALETLKPIENWPGVARAHAARAQAYESLGKAGEATADRKEQAYYEAQAGQEADGTR